VDIYLTSASFVTLFSSFMCRTPLARRSCQQLHDPYALALLDAQLCHGRFHNVVQPLEKIGDRRIHSEKTSCGYVTERESKFISCVKCGWVSLYVRKVWDVRSRIAEDSYETTYRSNNY